MKITKRNIIVICAVAVTAVVIEGFLIYGDGKKQNDADKTVMQEQVEEFRSLPAEEKEAFLDKTIEDLQQQWAQPQPQVPTPSTAGQSEQLTPEQKEQFLEFRQALRKRMLEKGIEPGRPNY